MDTLIILISLLGLIVLLMCMYAAYKLGAYVTGMRKEIAHLKKAQRAEMPYRALNGTEDATAIALDLERDIRLLELRLKQQLDVLHRLRQDGANYDPDRPAGRRPEL